MVELNQGLLADLGGWPALKEARALVERGKVLEVTREGAVIRARVQGAEKIHEPQITLADRVANVSVRCTCTRLAAAADASARMRWRRGWRCCQPREGCCCFGRDSSPVCRSKSTPPAAGKDLAAIFSMMLRSACRASNSRFFCRFNSLMRW